MKFGIILQSNKPEHVWNTFRFANASLKAGHSVKINLNSKQFDISKKIEEFKSLKRILVACGSCLEIRSKRKSKVCPVGTMKDLAAMVEETDKMLVFG